jgi:hypothetical protein
VLEKGKWENEMGEKTIGTGHSGKTSLCYLDFRETYSLISQLNININVPPILLKLLWQAVATFV